MADTSTPLALDRQIVINQVSGAFYSRISALQNEVFAQHLERARTDAADDAADKAFGVTAREDQEEAFDDKDAALEEDYEVKIAALRKERSDFFDRQQKEREKFEAAIDAKEEKLDAEFEKSQEKIEAERETAKTAYFAKVLARPVGKIKRAMKRGEYKLSNQADVVINTFKSNHIRDLRAAHPNNKRVEALSAQQRDAMTELSLATSMEELSTLAKAWISSLAPAKAKASAKVRKASPKKAKARKAKSKPAKKSRKK